MVLYPILFIVNFIIFFVLWLLKSEHQKIYKQNLIGLLLMFAPAIIIISQLWQRIHDSQFERWQIILWYQYFEQPF